MAARYPKLVQSKVSENQFSKMVDAADVEEVSLSTFMREAIKKHIQIRDLRAGAV